MKVRVQLIENNPIHKVPSVFVNIHRTQFIFNVIPTLLRHRKKHKLNLHNSSHIFFTKNSIEAHGGLPNFLLFRSGTQHANKVIANKIYFYGNTQLISYFEKLRFKLGYKALRFSYTDWEKNKYRYGIQSLDLFDRVKKDPQLPMHFAKMQEYLRQKYNKRDYFDSRFYISNTPNKFVTLECPYFHTNLVDIYPIPVTTSEASLTNYLLVFTEQKKGIDFDIEKFVQETEIIKQQKLKELIKKGVIEHQGKTYKKADYLFKEDFKPKNILIFHYTDLQSVQQLSSSPVFSNYLENKNETGLVVHIVQDTSILQTSDFQTFLSLLGKDTKHLWFNNQGVTISDSQTRFLEQNLLQNQVWAEVFPLLISNCFSQRMGFYQYKKSIVPLMPCLNSYFYKRLFSYVKNDYKGDTYEERIEAHPKKYSKQQILKRLIDSNSTSVRSMNNLEKQKKSDFQPNVVFLGTSSSMPTVHRNTSGYLVRFSQDTSFLLDCGEQTLQQFVNHCNNQTYEEQLLKIKVIFITHIHSDHNLGILNLIAERKRIMKTKSLKEKVFLIIPFNVYNWYASFNETVEDLSQACDVLFTQVILQQSYEQVIQRQLNTVKNEEKQLKKSEGCNLNNFQDRFFAELQTSVKTKQLVTQELTHQHEKLKRFTSFLSQHGYTTFLPMRVVHCPQSFGIVIANNEFKISYSGDTRPTDSFKQLARESNLMIHEATFNDAQGRKAKQYRHSTVEEAVQVGYESNAQFLALTHFNTAFKIPSKINNQKYHFFFKLNTIFGLDHLELPLRSMNAYPQVTKFISKISQEAQMQFSKIE